MDKLRVDSGIKNIEVNDNGDYISIPIRDTSFYQKFAELIKKFEKKQEDVDKRYADLAEKHKDKQQDDIDAISDSVNLYSDLCKEICDDLDGLFGEGCCKKVFLGVEHPGIDMIGDFLDQIAPFLNQYIEEQSNRISFKYNRNRKGARSGKK